MQQNEYIGPMGEDGVDAYWQRFFGEISVRGEHANRDDSFQELLAQFRGCLAIESPDPGTLKQLGYYVDFACQILRFVATDSKRDLEKCRQVIGFIGECRDLLNAALTKPLPEFYWQRIAHYVENQASRILQIREMAERERGRW